MKCPHCLTGIHPDLKKKSFGSDGETSWSITYDFCPICNKLIIDLYSIKDFDPNTDIADENWDLIHSEKVRIYPIGTNRPPAPKEVVDKNIAQDYTEACLVLNLSPKASAALSRRCLQNLLREKAGVKKADLFKEIQEVIDSNSLPSDLAKSIDAIRIIGNYAAHPLKSTSSGEIVNVEPGEAEWSLDVLENLFDFYYVRPANLAAKREALNNKLAELGKPPMK